MEKIKIKRIKKIGIKLGKMSSNNMLVVIKRKLFEVHSHDCVDNDFEPTNDNLLYKAETLKQAVQWANEYCKHEIVEYGIKISDECWE